MEVERTAGHEEIKITKEMLLAGVHALWAYSSEVAMQEDCVEDIYRAMVEARDRRDPNADIAQPNPIVLY